MLYYVERGVEFTNQYGDIDESFYNSMEGMYLAAAGWIVKHSLQSAFRERCEEVVQNTRNIGWGFHDTLGDIFGEHFEQEGDHV